VEKFTCNIFYLHALRELIILMPGGFEIEETPKLVSDRAIDGGLALGKATLYRIGFA
jgi:hypothetical protein